MSRENVEVLAKVLGALGAWRFDTTQEGVPEAIVARLDPDIEFEPDPRILRRGSFADEMRCCASSR